MKKPFILISNDDGYHANGIKSLVAMVSSFAEVLVVAPESGRSGFSGAFSVTTPLRLKPRHNMPNAEVWSCNGTPVDCVKLALDQFCQNRRPDLILSGINHGDNSSVNTHYSGTMGAAMEGCMKYIPSIAFSSCDYDVNADLSPLAPYVQRIVQKVLSEGLPKGICLNVNFPAGKDFQGVKACRMAYAQWIKEVVKERHPRDFDYFWMVGEYRCDEPEAEDTDYWALAHNYVAITPTQMDVTAHEFIKEVNSWEL
uniref:5'-nucleotidase SurE n=1 Tax=Prevotella sp. GTC17254 TaxID=3236794 RepID=A0AB33J2Y9_9BACT